MKTTDNSHNSPEAIELEQALTEFQAASQALSEVTKHVQAGSKSHVDEMLKKSDILSLAELRLLAAREAYERVWGGPEVVQSTALVLKVVSITFPPDHQVEVNELLEQKIGRNLPFRQNDSAQELERVRLAVLKVANGSLKELRRQIAVAIIDWRDVINAAEYPEASKMSILSYTKLDQKRRREVNERDRRQYEDWLKTFQTS